MTNLETAAEMAWQAWYEPQPLGECHLPLSPRKLAHAAFLAAYDRGRADLTEYGRALAAKAIDKFVYDLGFTAPELYPMRIDQLRELIHDAFDPATCTCPDDCELEH